MPGTLWVVGTPIGNLEDVTERARRVLGSVGLIACEDTRRTGRLLQHLGIEPKRLVSFFEGNEKRRVPELIEELRGGADVAVVTDAGMPGVSDPGYRLVAACVEEGIAVDVAPGPSAVVAALVISGLPTDRFVFEGFLPRAGKARTERLAALAEEPRTVVLFESPNRVARSLHDLAAGGDRRVAVVRELTKLHQEIIRGTVGDVAALLGGRDLKGEIVVVMEGAQVSPPDLDEAVRVASALVERGMTKRGSAREAASRTGIPARRIYDALLTRAAGDGPAGHALGARGLPRPQ
ncbi:MAG TPA: 16S rRNA (cytidine(1402)-2'-O)-methyltransferase [Actinomycetota bacterium]